MENYTGLRIQVNNIVLGSEVAAGTPTFSIVKGESYVLQWKQISHNANTVMDKVRIDYGGALQQLESININNFTTVNNIDGKAEKLCYIKFKATQTSDLARVIIARTLKNGDIANSPLFDIRQIKVNRGINMASWSENETDSKVALEKLKTSIDQTAKELSLKASSTELDIVNNILSKAYAEIKVNAKEIALRVADDELLSSINIKTSGIQIQSETVNVRGVFTTYDPTKPHIRYMTVADGFLHLYKNTSVTKPSMSLGYWGKNGTVPYISIGRDDAWNTSASGMLYITANEDDYSEDYRIEYARLSRDGQNTVCRSNVHFMTDGTMGYNSFAEIEFPHTFNKGIHVNGNVRCSDVKANNLVGRETAIGIWGQGNYGGVAMDSGIGYFMPLYDLKLANGHPAFRWTTIHLENAPTVTSDSRCKENIRYTSNASGNETTYDDMYNFAKNLEIAQYDYKCEDEDRVGLEHSIGFIAQDLLNDKVGELIINKDVGKYLSYNLGTYTNVLAGALKKAIDKIELLENKIELLEASV